MKKTNEEIAEFHQVASVWLAKNETENRFRYAVAKMAKRAEKVRVRINEKITDIDVNHAIEVEDEKTKQKKLLVTEGRYEFSRDGTNAKNKELRAFMQEEREIEPHFADVPDDLKSEFRVIFEGFVIKESTNGTSPPT